MEKTNDEYVNITNFGFIVDHFFNFPKDDVSVDREVQVKKIVDLLNAFYQRGIIDAVRVEMFSVRDVNLEFQRILHSQKISHEA